MKAQLELRFLSWVTQFQADLTSRSLVPTRQLRERLDPKQDRVRESAASLPRVCGEIGSPQGSEAVKGVSQQAIVFYREAVRDE